MIALGQANTPRLVFVMACVDFVGEHVFDALRVDVTLGIAGKNHMGAQETRNLAWLTKRPEA